MSDSDESDVPDLWAYPDPAAVEQPKDEVEEEVEVIAETKQETRVGTRKRTQKEIEVWMALCCVHSRGCPRVRAERQSFECKSSQVFLCTTRLRRWTDGSRGLLPMTERTQNWRLLRRRAATPKGQRSKRVATFSK